jgi:hypothetical protein
MLSGWRRPIAAPLERCAELLCVDLDTLKKAAAHVEPYIRGRRHEGLEPHATGATAPP